MSAVEKKKQKKHGKSHLLFSLLKDHAVTVDLGEDNWAYI